MWLRNELWGYYTQRYSFDRPKYAIDFPYFSWFRDSMKTNWIKRDEQTIDWFESLFWMDHFWGVVLSENFCSLYTVIIQNFQSEKKKKKKRKWNKPAKSLSVIQQIPTIHTVYICILVSSVVYILHVCSLVNFLDGKRNCAVTIVAHQTKHCFFFVQRTVIEETGEGKKINFPTTQTKKKLKKKKKKNHGTIGRACRERHGYLNYISS